MEVAEECSAFRQLTAHLLIERGEQLIGTLDFASGDYEVIYIVNFANLTFLPVFSSFA